MIRSELITTYYKDGQFAREWRMNYQGQPEVTYNAHPVNELTSRQKYEIERRNALVRAQIYMREQRLKMKAVPKPDEDVPRRIPAQEDQQGDADGMVIHPAWDQYEKAQSRLNEILSLDEVEGDSARWDYIVDHPKTPPQYIDDGQGGQIENPEYTTYQLSKERYIQVVWAVLPDSPSVVEVDDYK